MDTETSVEIETELVPGRRYLVRWGDCCIAGEFAGHFEGYDYEDDGPGPEGREHVVVAVHFAEGLTLTQWGAVDIRNDPA